MPLFFILGRAAAFGASGLGGLGAGALRGAGGFARGGGRGFSFGGRGLGQISRSLNAGDEFAEEIYGTIIEKAAIKAVNTMSKMVENPGQIAIFEKYIPDAFFEAVEVYLIDPGPGNADYLEVEMIDMPHTEAVSITLQAGCDIVNDAVEYADDLVGEFLF
jgi:hypothetical protein